MGQQMLATVLALGALSGAMPLMAQTNAPCAITPQERAEFLALGYREFDQRPGEGWRGLAGGPDERLACALTVAELIDEYARTNAEKLTHFNLRILSWHAGQFYGFADRTNLARDRFIASMNPDEAEDAPPWNAYVRATVAFLDGDLDEIQRQRAVIVATESQMNLEVVDRLIAGFGKSYAEAYSRQ